MSHAVSCIYMYYSKQQLIYKYVLCTGFLLPWVRVSVAIFRHVGVPVTCMCIDFPCEAFSDCFPVERMNDSWAQGRRESVHVSSKSSRSDSQLRLYKACWCSVTPDKQRWDVSTMLRGVEETFAACEVTPGGVEFSSDLLYYRFTVNAAELMQHKRRNKTPNKY